MCQKLLSLAALALILLVLETCEAQRTVASLGSKLKSFRRSDPPEVIEVGEWEWGLEQSSFHYIAGIFCVVSFALVMLTRRGEGDEKGDGESASVRPTTRIFLRLHRDVLQAFVTERRPCLSITHNLFLKTSTDIDELAEEEITLDPIHSTDPIDIAFEGIRMELEQKKGPPRLLLDGSIRGRARPGKMLAIMGPSGSGKSTLLHALAGQVKDSSKLSLTGIRYVNGQPVTGDSSMPVAVIEQDVNFFPHMTVRETLNFRAELKLGKKLTLAQRNALVDELLEDLHLSKAANTVVGNTKIRGISGGERKRLSIACEMIASPSVIFLVS